MPFAETGNQPLESEVKLLKYSNLGLIESQAPQIFLKERVIVWHYNTKSLTHFNELIFKNLFKIRPIWVFRFFMLIFNQLVSALDDFIPLLFDILPLISIIL
jgi:hypothetical protein